MTTNKTDINNDIDTYRCIYYYIYSISPQQAASEGRGRKPYPSNQNPTIYVF
jgi:hypothetical protein